MTAKRQPAEYQRRRYRIDLNGPLTGHHVTMTAMSGRDLIAMKRGDMDEADIIDLVASRCIEHDLPVADVRDLDAQDIGSILERWGDVLKETALPLGTATPSSVPSDAPTSIRTRR